MLLPGAGGPAATAAGPPERWQPAPDARWQYQLESSDRRLASTGGIDVGICQVPHSGGGCVHPDVFDIDLYVDGQVSGNDHTIDTAAVDAIHNRGAHAVCYMSAGTAERFRPDYHRYVSVRPAPPSQPDRQALQPPLPERVLAQPQERPRAARLRPAAGSRPAPQKCARAGFDGVEYDVVDAYAQGHKVTGWHITAHNQLVFDRALARIAHRNGLSVALKNDLGQVPKLEPRFDYAINEQCFQYHECTNNPAPGYKAFTRAGKAVFQVEYQIPPSRFCGKAGALGISSIKKASRLLARRRSPGSPAA